MQSAQHLARQFFRDIILCGPRRLKQSTQPRLRCAGEKGIAAKAEFQPRQHGTAFNTPKGRKRPRQPSRRFPTRSIDQAQCVARNQNTKTDIFFAQQALKPLVRACFPLAGGELVATVRIKRGLDHHQSLHSNALRCGTVPQDGHIGHKQGLMLGNDGG